MCRLVVIAASLVLVLTPLAAAAGPASPEDEIRTALQNWTDDFNAGRADKVCDLFAPVLRADVRGAPERDFDTQCRLLRKALADSEHAITDAFSLKEVVVERDMAVVRLTWTETIRVKATGLVTTRFDEGLDVFGRGSDGTWRIIRYMAFERP
jgi:ketosteroid isomerase-like protein